jgi:hypothetical protein
VEQSADPAMGPVLPAGSASIRWRGVGRRVLRWIRGLGPPAAYLALALYLSWPLVSQPTSRLSPGGTGSDETLTQWLLTHTAYAVAHLDDPFVTQRLNAPTGVNLAAQASMVGLGVPLTPVTLLFGGPVALAVLIVTSPAATATAWYWLLHARLRLHWLAAAVAGLLCGFSPQLLLESTGRNHVAMQALVPVLIWQILQLGRPDHPVRRGVVVGLLVTWQALIGEEVLLLLALALLVFFAAWLAMRPREARLIGRYARGLGIAVAVALPLLAYPLWRQFFGPGHMASFAGYDAYRAFPGSYLGLPENWASRLPPGDAWWSVAPPAVLGLPLLVLTVAVVALYRRTVVLACGVVALVFLVLSLSSPIDLGPSVHLTGPWSWVSHAPLFDAVLPSRMILVVTSAVAVILGYGLDAALRHSGAALAAARSAGPLRAVPALAALAGFAVLLGVAVYQLAPRPYPTWRPTPVPAFAADGHWRTYLTGGRSLVTVPVTSMFWGDGQRMATATGTAMTIAGGYFLSPDPATGVVLPTSPPTWTSTYFEQTIAAGKPPPPVPGDRERMLADLRFWRAGVLVLLPQQVYAGALRSAVERLLGPPHWDAGVWFWDVRALLATPR